MDVLSEDYSSERNESKQQDFKCTKTANSKLSDTKTNTSKPEAAATSPVTLEDLEKKLAASTLNSGEVNPILPVDPTKLLSLNLLAQDIKEAQYEKVRQTELEEFSDFDLPTAFQNLNPSVFADEFFAARTTTNSDGSDSDANLDLVLDIEPTPLDQISGGLGDTTNSLLDPKDYEHIFDDSYLQDIIRITEGGEENQFDLIKAFDNFDLDKEDNSVEEKEKAAQIPMLQESASPEKSKLDFFKGSGQPIYCLPCKDGAEEVISIPENLFDTELDPTALENLRQENLDLDLDLDLGENNLTAEEMQLVLRHVMEAEEAEEAASRQCTIIPQSMNTDAPTSNTQTEEATSRQCTIIPPSMNTDASTRNTQSEDAADKQCTIIPRSVDTGAPTHKTQSEDAANKQCTTIPQSMNTDASMQSRVREEPQLESQQDDEIEPLPFEPAQYYASNRPKALKIAEPIANAFYAGNERQCYGHKSSIFGMAMSPCGKFCATASQDSTICVWDVERNSLLNTIKESNKYECLRVAWASDKWGVGHKKGNFQRSPGDLILATSGAGGIAKIWHSTNNALDWKPMCTLDHLFDKKEYGEKDGKLSSIAEGEEAEKAENDKNEEKEEEGSEIYSLQFIDKWLALPSKVHSDDLTSCESRGAFMTSSEDFIHIWQHNPRSEHEIEDNSNMELNMDKIMDIKFTHLEHGYGGVFVHLNIGEGSKNQPEWAKAGTSNVLTNIVSNKKAFGGDRNPNKLVYVFDAVQCPANNLLGVALSDGTTRLVNGRGICVTILQLPDCQSHLTSFSWDKSGRRLASCVGSGQLVIWDIHCGDGKGAVQPQCRAVLEGGHDEGRPLFGSAFFGGDNEDLLLSWGVDGRLVLWDSYSQGQIGAPICILVCKDNYPIYAVDVFERHRTNEGDKVVSTIGIAGGSDGGFIGLPAFLHNF